MSKKRKKSNALEIARRSPDLNHELRDMPSVPFSACKAAREFRVYAKTHLLPSLDLTGYKLKQKQRLAVDILHNLVCAGMVHHVIADSRAWHTPGAKARSKIWDGAVKAGFARQCLGSEESGKVTRYHASNKLLKPFINWPPKHLLDFDLARNTARKRPTWHALIVLHGGRKDRDGKLLPDDQQKLLLPLPKIPEWKFNYLNELQNAIEMVNRSNLEHTWKRFAVDPQTGRKTVAHVNPCLKQIYVGELWRGGRLYSWSPLSGQNIPKQDRRSIEIDGEPAAELDYSGYATRMLYHIEGIDPAGDIYRPEIILPKLYGLRKLTDDERALGRDLVKRATNICWNASSRKSAAAAIRKVIADHSQAKLLKRFVYDLEDSTPAGIVARIEKAHAPLARHFFSEVGLHLMGIDGMIMLRILLRFARKYRPILGIHDSVVVKAEDAKRAKRVMIEIYRAFFGFDPIVKRVF